MNVQDDLAKKAAHKELRAISSQLAVEEGQKTSKRAKADAKKAEQKAKKAERGSGANHPPRFRNQSLRAPPLHPILTALSPYAECEHGIWKCRVCNPVPHK
jgi:hypothetical protein